MKLQYFKRSLQFKIPAGTSRGVLKEKPSWIFYFEENDQILGEVSIIPGLSPDYIDDTQFESKLGLVCDTFNSLIKDKSQQLVLSYFCVELKKFPSILFGLETLIYNWKRVHKEDVFVSDFSKGIRGIPINGLIWMGTKETMISQVKNKINEGFTIIKLKIGAIDFEDELNLIKGIREQYGYEIEIRVDANGAFKENNIDDILIRLKEQGVHSIEQPVEAGQHKLMKSLCSNNSIPIALDEELIGVVDTSKKTQLLNQIMPQYIILKPSLHGGIKGCMEWIDIASSMGIGWWLTSALESNIGLEMIARFAGYLDPKIPQGLGTGGLFHNNFQSYMHIKKGNLFLQNEEE